MRICWPELGNLHKGQHSSCKPPSPSFPQLSQLERVHDAWSSAALLKPWCRTSVRWKAHTVRMAEGWMYSTAPPDSLSSYLHSAPAPKMLACIGRLRASLPSGFQLGYSKRVRGAPLGEWRGQESQVNFLLPLGCVPLLEAAAPFNGPAVVAATAANLSTLEAEPLPRPPGCLEVGTLASAPAMGSPSPSTLCTGDQALF